MKTLLFSLLCFGLISSFSAKAEEKPMISIEVGKARVKRTIAAFPAIQASRDPEGKLRSVREITISDLDFSGIIDFLNPAAFIENPGKAGVTPGTFKLQDWSGIGAELLIKAKGSVEASGITLEVYVYDEIGRAHV